MAFGFFSETTAFISLFFSPLTFSVHAFTKIPVVTQKEEGERVQGRSEWEPMCVLLPVQAAAGREGQAGGRGAVQ